MRSTGEVGGEGFEKRKDVCATPWLLHGVVLGNGKECTLPWRQSGRSGSDGVEL